MIKQNQSKLNAVHVAMDSMISVSSCTLSYILYSAISSNNELYGYLSDIKVPVIFVAITALCQIIFNYAFDLYRSYRSTKFIVEAVNVLKSGLFFCIIQIAVAIFTQSLFKFQVVILFYYISNTFLAIVYRACLRNILKYMRSRGYNKKYIAIIGVNNCTDNFIRKIQTSTDMGYELSGYFASNSVTK